MLRARLFFEGDPRGRGRTAGPTESFLPRVEDAVRSGDQSRRDFLSTSGRLVGGGEKVVDARGRVFQGRVADRGWLTFDPTRAGASPRWRGSGHHDEDPMNRSTVIVVLPLLAVLAILGGVLGTAGAEQPPRTRKEFMRQKLAFSQKVLEGLTLEDFGAIDKNARALRLLSQAAEWEVPTIPNATDYVTFTTEFQRLCGELVQKAKDKNIDGATLAYLRLTMNCVNCHKFVRFATKPDRG
jgi:hypothetical protein